jgi:glycosyltransferase involved in cell wall biosynthesis
MSLPRISCLMVTADRPHYARRAIASFAAQSWPARELVVLDNGATPMRPLLDGLPPAQVVYRHIPKEAGRYIGALRNESLEMATGDFVVPQWDDDDWSHPERLSIQAEVLLRGHDACALPGTLMHVDAPNYFLHPFIGLLREGVPPTVMHRRDGGIRYPNLRRTSDTTYLGQWQQRAYHLLPRGTEHLYVRYFHGGNLWEERHFVRRMRNTPRDLMAYGWHRFVRRDLLGHPRFRLGADARAAFDLYLAQSRPFGFFRHDPDAAGVEEVSERAA